MKITRKLMKIRCDSVMCGEMAGYEIESESYKGNIYLCDKCFANLQTNIKKVNIKNEKTK